MNKYETRRAELRSRRNLDKAIASQLAFADKYIFPVAVIFIILAVALIGFGIHRIWSLS